MTIQSANSLGLIDYAPSTKAFKQEVIDGLSRIPKELPCKLFYDRTGSELFDKITMLEEYYPTRTEIAILEEHSPIISMLLGANIRVVEFGSGSGIKTKILLNQLKEPNCYIPIDISKSALLETSRELALDLAMPVIPVCADYLSELEIPYAGEKPSKTLVFFPGSTIGTLEPNEAVALMKRMKSIAGHNGAVTIGVDLKKSKDVLELAYNDSEGVTAAFNKNLLVRISQEYNTPVACGNFQHLAVYDEIKGCIEMRLISLVSQTLTLDEQVIHFDKDEYIITEHSYKYTVQEFKTLALKAGLKTTRVWTDQRQFFAVCFLEPVDQVTV